MDTRSGSPNPDRGPMLYEENVPFPLVRIIMGVLFLAAFVFLVLAITYFTSGDDSQAREYTVSAIILTLIALVSINFITLRIRITAQTLTVSYGVFRDIVPLTTITGAYPDTVRSILPCGGWGIRFGRYAGQWRKVYNAIGYQNVVVRLTGRRITELAFATREPEKVLFLINREIRKTS